MGDPVAGSHIVMLCKHGLPVDSVDVTTFRDTRPHRIPLPCDCPRPYCPLCEYELDPTGRCQGDIECALYHHLVPNPVIR